LSFLTVQGFGFQKMRWVRLEQNERYGRIPVGGMLGEPATLQRYR
jgi:hypothetical protein